MGLGDWIMASAQARRAHEETGQRVVFTNGLRAWWEEQVFAGNPRIAQRMGPGLVPIANYPGHRPYIRQVTKDRFIFDPDFRAEPGELFIERPTPADYIVVEPHVKRALQIGPNKDWGLSNWREVLKLDLPWVQVGTEEPITRRVETRTFREALRVLAGARLFVGTDGALHHAAAALGIPAVVIWGGLASPVNLGYESHVNLWSGAEPCGTHSGPCEHCRRALAQISVEQVRDAVERAYEGSERHLVA